MVVPNLIVACAGGVSRRRAQRALMAAGGRLGFRWRFERLSTGGLFAVVGARDQDRHEILAELHRHLDTGRPAATYLLSQWRRPLTDADLVRVGGWFGDAAMRARCHA